MNYKIFGKLFLCLALVFGAFSISANAQGAVGISGSVGKLRKGKIGKATITMNIPGGLHVNSNRPGSRYAIPTRIKISGAGLKFGAVAYPGGKTRKFTFSDEQISVYEGRTSFRVPVTVPANFKGGTAKIRVVVSYQSCTDEVCYRPRSGEVTLTATVE